MQQASFTSLVIVAFILKTIDTLHIIIRQARVDIFFIDWEKPKTGENLKYFNSDKIYFVLAGNLNSVSAWRSCFVANEYNEIQTFRRINVTFQLIFVLFLLKVIKSRQ